MQCTSCGRDITKIIDLFVTSLAVEVAALIKKDLTQPAPTIQPRLLDVNQAAVYLGRSERSIEHLILEKELPVCRYGRRVHLIREDLDHWIEKNRY